MIVLPRTFYLRNTEEVAKDLIGMMLVRTLPDGNRERFLSGVIVETEAYGHSDDRASHAYSGMTRRNEIMFGQVGRAYVYFTYGSHHCVNVSAKSPDSIAGAVLIRGIEPVEGIDIMKKLRGVDNIHLIASGPGRLAQALGITRAQNGVDMTNGKSDLRIEQGIKRKVIATTRIGITKAADRKWRFADPSSEFASGRHSSITK